MSIENNDITSPLGNLEKFENYIESDDIISVLNLLDELDVVELADLLIATDQDTRKKFINKHLTHNIHVIAELPLEIRINIVEELGNKDFANHIKYLQVDGIIDAIEDFDNDVTTKIISFLPKKINEVLKEVLSYPEESAGRLIHKDFILIPDNWTVGQALDLLRTYKNIPNTLYDIFIIDKIMHPVGSVRVSIFICSKRNVLLSDIMNTDLKIVYSSMDQEAVAELFQKYSLLSTLVLNDNNEIVGVITVEDILEVVQEEAEEDMLHLAKVSETDISTRITTSVKQRIKWLVITFISINCSSLIIGFFEGTLKRSVELVILMPILAAMAGNAGIQASTIAVMAVNSRQLTKFNMVRVFFKELMIGFLNGIIISILMVAVILIRFHNVRLELTFIIAIVSVFALATSLGASVPLIVHTFKGDPALCSSIITSSFTDIVSFLILLIVASIIVL